MIYFFTVLVVLDTAHTLSPMAMAWSRGDFRAVMLRRWPKYILIPSAVLATSLAAATQGAAGADTVFTIYFAWNVWHFASQNYGLLRLLQIRRGWSWSPDWPFCMAITIVGMAVWPMLADDPWHWRLINLAIFAIPHWVSEIFLTSLLGISGQAVAPTYDGLYSGSWQHPKCSGENRASIQ